MSPLSGKAAHPRPMVCGHRHGVPSRMKPEAPAIRMKQHRSRKKTNIAGQNHGEHSRTHLVGGFNNLEKYESQWEGLSHISCTNKTCSKPPTRK